MDVEPVSAKRLEDDEVLLGCYMGRIWAYKISFFSTPPT